jgi:general secretion pathway protein M
VAGTRSSRAAAVAVLLVLLAGVWLAAAEPWLGALGRYDDEIGQARMTLGRHFNLGAEKAGLQGQLEALRRDRARGQGLLPGANAQLAAADLQGRVKRVVEANGSVLRSTQVLPTRDEAGYRQVGIRISIEAEVDGLQKMLHALESATPHLFVTNLDVRARQVRAGRAGAERAAGMAVTLDVYGYMRVPAP